MLGALTVVAVAKVERQAFAAVPVIGYESLEDYREPSLMWIARSRPPVGPPDPIAFVYLLALAAFGWRRAFWFRSHR